MSRVTQAPALVRTTNRRVLGSAGAALCLAAVLVTATGAFALFKGSALNSTNTFSSATMQLEGTTPTAVNCYSTGTGSGGSVTAADTGSCAGDPLPPGTVTSTSSSSAATTLSALGTVNPTAATMGVGVDSCGVEQFADTTGNDTALAVGGVTYGTTGPIAGSGAVTFNGTSGLGETTTQYTNPGNLTYVAWIKTSASGSILGFSNSPTTSGATVTDRDLWIGSNGLLNFGVDDILGIGSQIASTSAVDTGAWVMVAATLTSLGLALYVNGTSVATGLALVTDNYSGYYSLGWSAVASPWGDLPSSKFFNGALSMVSISSPGLSAANIATLYAETSATAYQSALATMSPIANWQLNDTGSVPYTGAIPALSANSSLVTDVSGYANTGTAEAGVTKGAVGPWSGTGAATFSGATTAQVTTTTSYVDPVNFTLAGWFKSSSTSGGTVIGFDSSQTSNTLSQYDRAVYLDNAGHLDFFVNPGGLITSPSTYNNGSWHFVVASLGAAGLQLYVDGTLVASNASITNSGAGNYSGWWRLGWDGPDSADVPTDNAWNGTLADLAVIPSQLTSGQVTTLDGAGSFSAFSRDAMALRPTSYWPLNDTTTTTPCDLVETTIQATQSSINTCLFPAGTGACPALSTLALANEVATEPLPLLSTTVPVSVSVTMKLTAASGAGVLGLHVLLGLTFADSLSSWSASLSYVSASVGI